MADMQNVYSARKKVDLQEFCRIMGTTEEESLIYLGKPVIIPDDPGHDYTEVEDG